MQIGKINAGLHNKRVVEDLLSNLDFVQRGGAAWPLPVDFYDSTTLQQRRDCATRLEVIL